MDTKDAARSLVDRAFEEMARQAIRDVIEKNVGSGLDSEVKTAIREYAAKLVKSDPEIQQMIRERMIYWIGKQ